MKCPECDFESADGAAECPACGLIFDRWKEFSASKPSPIPEKDAEAPESAPEDPSPSKTLEAKSENTTPSNEAPKAKTDEPSRLMKKKGPGLNPTFVGVALVLALLAFVVFRFFTAPPSAPPADAAIAVPTEDPSLLVSVTPDASQVVEIVVAESPTPSPTDTPTAIPTPKPVKKVAPPKPTAVPTQPPKTEAPVPPVVSQSEDAPTATFTPIIDSKGESTASEPEPTKSLEEVASEGAEVPQP
jgi:hypothetical protein